MARDYKRSGTKKQQTTHPAPWLWMVAGFGLGLVAALGLYLNLRPPTIDSDTPVPDVIKQTQSASDIAEHAGAELQSNQDSQKRATIDKPASLPAKGPAPYEFYDILPGFEVVVPDNGSSDNSSSGSATTTRTKPVKPGNYILQAGSFKKFTDADRRKAELAFKGIESIIQQVVLEKNQTWYRVYVGPTKNVATLEKNRRTLRRDNIDAYIFQVGQ